MPNHDQRRRSSSVIGWFLSPGPIASFSGLDQWSRSNSSPRNECRGLEEGQERSRHATDRRAIVHPDVAGPFPLEERNIDATPSQP